MKKIALVTEEISVHGRSGGIGAAMYELSISLSRLGHSVDIIYVPTSGISKEEENNMSQHFVTLGVRFHVVDCSKYLFNTEDVRGRAYSVFIFLKTINSIYEFIHFHDYKGLGFWCVNAKRQGLAFESTALIVQLHGPLRWALHANRALFSRADHLFIDYMERESIRYADHVVSPSRYLVDWLSTNGFVLPPEERVHVIKNASEQSARFNRDRRAPGTPVTIHELVFFGRHEPRKGFATFCDALDMVEVDLAESGISVTFLGGLGQINGLPSGLFLSERARRWRFAVDVRVGLNRSEALAFLASRTGALVVVPSFAENSPYTVVEAVALGCPVLTSLQGGGRELIDPDYHNEAVVEAEPEAIAARLRTLIATGVRVPAPAESPEMIAAQWSAFHEAVRTLQPPRRHGAETSSAPRVTVGITHFERPRKVIGAIMSVLRQTYPNIELVVVDDGSRSPETIAALPAIEALLKRVGGRLIRRDNGYLGAARNTAARSTDSEYLLFLDDDDLLLPHAVERLVAVAVTTQADVVNCFNVYLEATARHEYEIEPESYVSRISYIPIGGPLSTMHIMNNFGAATALIKRETFDRLGGYTEIRRVGYEDYEFYLRAAQAGANICIVPEVLYLYEVGKPSMITSTSRITNKHRIVEAIDVSADPTQWHDAIELAAGREALEDEANFNTWRASTSPHQAEIREAIDSAHDLQAHLGALAKHAAAIGSPLAGVWRQSARKPEDAPQEGPRRRMVPARPDPEATVLDDLSAATELMALWKLGRFEDAVAETARTLGRTGHANETIIDFAFLLAGDTRLRSGTASELARLLGTTAVEEMLVGKLRGAIAALEIAASSYESAKTLIAEIAASESRAYVEHYPDLKAAFRSNPAEQGLQHFRRYGADEGRDGFPILQRIALVARRRSGRDVKPWHLRYDFDRQVAARH